MPPRFCALISHCVLRDLILSVSSIQLLLIRLHVNAAFQLGARSPNLKPESAILDTRVKLLEALNAGILHRVFQTSSKVRHKLVDGSAS